MFTLRHYKIIPPPLLYTHTYNTYVYNIFVIANVNFNPIVFIYFSLLISEGKLKDSLSRVSKTGRIECTCRKRKREERGKETAIRSLYRDPWIKIAELF